jgi:hypothetical protein
LVSSVIASSEQILRLEQRLRKAMIAPVLTTTLLSMLLLMTLTSACAGIKRGTARR